METKNVVLLGLGAFLVGFAVKGLLADRGKPSITVLPLGKSKNSEMPIINFEIDGKAVSSSFSDSSQNGMIEDNDWVVRRIGKGNDTFVINVFNTKTKKSSSTVISDIKPSDLKS